MRVSRLLALVFLLSASTILAQSTAGEISGVVTDPSGSVVPGVSVSLTNPSTNTTRSVKTNESGLYVIPAIQPAVYDLKVELSGFRAIERKEITVQVGSPIESISLWRSAKSPVSSRFLVVLRFCRRKRPLWERSSKTDASWNCL